MNAVVKGSAITLLMLATSASLAATGSPPESDNKAVSPAPSTRDVSYALGASLARSIQQQGIAVVPDEVIAGLRAVLETGTPRLSEREVDDVLTVFNRHRIKRIQREKEAGLKAEAARAAAYLDEHKKRSGVTALSDGVQYKVLESGNGKKPEAGDTVRLHYRLYDLEGELVQDTRGLGEPLAYPLDRTIPGWSEILPLMPEGALWRVALAPEQAFGRGRPAPGIPRGAGVVYEIEIMEIAQGVDQ